MLKKILSISGKPGLYKMISQGKNMIIVESLLTGKRTPAYAHDKIISLGDIAIFTQEGEEPLQKVLNKIKIRENGETIKQIPADADALRNYFAEILPEFDRNRVHPSDIKKVVSWYNLLTEKGYANFEEEEEKSEEK